MIVEVKNLKYSYRTFKKQQGFRGAIKDFLSRNYVKKCALDNLDFSIEKGSIIGLLGPNGAGKTTLIKLLTGMIAPESGTISVLGYNPHKKNKNFLKQIGVVLGQKSQLIWDLPPKDTFSTLKVIYEIGEEDYHFRLESYSKLLNVEDHLNTPARNLSLGERMKCEIIASLLHNPGVLFLDEPTIGLDIQSQKTIRTFLVNMARECGVTIIFTSHHLVDIEKLCDKLYILKNGSLSYQGGVQQLIDKCSHKYVIEYKTEQLQDTIECEPSQLNSILHKLTSNHMIIDLKLSKCSLEEAIYVILESS